MYVPSACVGVVVGVVGGVALAGGGDVILVGIWPCVAVVVGVVDGVLVVGSVMIRTYIHVITMCKSS